MDTADIILAELRELRSDYNEHAKATGERLSKLETQMHDLLGNGNPGRLRRLEIVVEHLQAWRWYLLGAGAAVSALITGAAWVFSEAHK